MTLSGYILTDAESREIGRELTLRNDFNQRMQQLTRRLASAMRDDEGLGETRVLLEFVQCLGEFPGIDSVAAVEVGEGEDEPRVLACSNEHHLELWGALVEELHVGVVAALKKDLASSAPLPSAISIEKYGLAHGELRQVAVHPCYEASPRVALAVLTWERAGLGLTQWMLSDAATRTGLVLVMLRLAEHRKKYHKLGMRFAQMSSSGITTAKLRLARLTRELAALDTHAEFAGEVDAIIEELESAQRGLDRAKLLHIPGSVFAHLIDLDAEVQAIIRELNSAVDGGVVEGVTCPDNKYSVSASPIRLHYAVRELILATWFLNERAPTRVFLSREGSAIQLEIAAKNVKLPERWPRAGRPLLERLLDPDLQWAMRRNHRAERGASVDLPCELFAGMGGHVNVVHESGEFRFTVRMSAACAADEDGS